ncbi:MAG: DNA polymerase/3'-5' exonuclease PolX [Sphingobacteriales bacterium]|nr:MAG: DNA polymerase/3'-5' exonuclease PolX [Sphingobacteriales bacterium]
MPDNYSIADQFSLLSKLMDIHGENSFRAKSYSIAAFNIEKLPVQLSTLSAAEIIAQKGIGDSTGKKVMEILQTGKLDQLEKLVASTPPGVLDMLNIKGIGPKKINTIWKEMQIESLGELLYACEENRLLLYKGFGAKTQQNVRDAIEFYLSNRESFLYAEVEAFAHQVQNMLSAAFPGHKIQHTGAFRRQLEIIEQLEWITTIPEPELTGYLAAHEIAKAEGDHQPWIRFKGQQNLTLSFICTTPAQFARELFETSCSTDFLHAWKSAFTLDDADDETQYFEQAGISVIPAARREDPSVIRQPAVTLIQPSDIKGIIHAHSQWSDGSQTLEEMAKACMEQGFEYLVISDHSKSAFYANGLSEERIAAQHQQIDELNAKYPAFRIFKSIECDILNDGSLDYSNDVLASFDLVITSIHSNLKMTEEKAMARLLKAIEHPSTTILGHMTGRLLLSRKGYPVDHQKIIDVCKANDVVIELNAHPRRLDIDWRFIQLALDKGAMISIDPDAHSADGYKDVTYGVLAAQKGGLTKERNLSSFSRKELEQYLSIG